MSGSGHGVAGACVLPRLPPRRLLVERSELESSVSRSRMPLHRTAHRPQRPAAREHNRAPVGPPGAQAYDHTWVRAPWAISCTAAMIRSSCASSNAVPEGRHRP